MSQDDNSSPSNNVCSIGSDTLIFSEEPDLQSSRRAAFDRLKSIVGSLADFEGPENVSLVRAERHDNGAENSNTSTVVFINSLLFQVTSRIEPILVILSSSNRVDMKKLEAHLEQGDDDERISVSLTPAHLVEEQCGFPPQSVPPLGHAPQSIRTLVDSQLFDDPSVKLLGGGGHPLIGCRIAAETLLKLEGTEVADISSGSGTTVEDDPPTQVQELQSHQIFPKPFFPIAPPDTETAAFVVQHPNEQNPLKPQPITIVGRINGVRRMAQRLVFCDLAPPNYVCNSTKFNQYDLPWKSGIDGHDMSVQLIAGKTFCKNRGDIDGPAMLKKFKVGQLVLVQGKTNVGNRESVGHWVEKRSLDIVVWDYQLLDENSMMTTTNPLPTPPFTVQVQPPVSTLALSSAELRRRQLSASVPAQVIASTANMNYLRLSDIFEQPEILVLDSLESVHRFAQDLRSVSTERVNGERFIPLLVGVDAEWKPSFMMASPSDPQPVLLLQISIQKLQTVYLMDLQALLRPVLGPSNAMNELESATSTALTLLFASTKFLKTGFQLMADLKRLAGSYPHVDAFRVFHGVVEVSAVAKKAMQLGRVRNSRQFISSLSRLTQYALEKPLDKEQQISDWSIRPLSSKQQEYASLDAAVLPILFEKSLELAGAGWVAAGDDDDGSLLRLGRWEDDASFLRSISSIRFLFLDSDEPTAVRKLKAKKVVSDRYIVTQSWAEGMEEPNLPSIPSLGGEGPYTDVSGIVRVPSLLVSLNHNTSNTGDVLLAELLGRRLGKSKDSCLEPLLTGNPDYPNGAKLEYQHRSGYVEFADSVALYVTMPLKFGDPPPRGYPNVWLDEGKSMTWFLRESEWDHGKTRVAKKLLGKTSDCTINSNGDDGSSIIHEDESRHSQTTVRAILFVRMGRGEFLACGRCLVTQLVEELSEMTEKKVAKDWGLVELHLALQDWDDLQNVKDFTSMTKATRVEQGCEGELASVASTSPAQQEDCSPSRLSELVLNGDVVGAMGLALRNQSGQEQSIEVGLATLMDILAAESAHDTMKAMEVLADLTHKFAH